ncbi:MAG: M42 family peptidase, partial [Oscillospiraceae bacterium]|nr:M42 family peptidase [Oscillospiraceae bacterium]
MRDLIKALCELPGVSGREEAVREYIKACAEPYADRLITDALGNLMVYRKGTDAEAPTVMLCAHMDETGLLVRAVTGDGYLKFVCAGSIDRRVLPGRRVLIGPDKLPGIIGMRAVHLCDEEERKKLPKLEHMYIDAGFVSKDEALQAVSPGEYVTFDTAWHEFGDGMVCAKAADDRVGCAALLKLM